MGAARKSITSPEGREANRPPVRYGAPAAAVLRAQPAAPSYPSASVASVRSAILPGNARDALDPAGNRGGTKPDSVSVAPLAVRHPEPSDREVSRSARRLSILGARGGSSHARRLPGSARPKVDGTRPDGDPVTLASVVGVTVAAAVTFYLLLFAW